MITTAAASIVSAGQVLEEIQMRLGRGESSCGVLVLLGW
jgi:hypothetical protein